MTDRPSFRRARLAALPFCILLSAGRAEASAPRAAPGDPWEAVNRVFFGLHQALDVVLFRPAAMTYARVFPKPVRIGLHHAVVNLSEPRVAINDILQGREGRAVKSLLRFTTNSTLGVFGLFDVAAKAGLLYRPNDFGVTLARYGVRPGPYLFVPLVGPTTLRDGFGGLVDLGLNPLNYVRYSGDAEVGVTSVVSDGLYQRAQADPQLKALEASATDVYASLRSYYLQNRQAEISGGRIDLNALPDFEDPASGPAALPPPAASPASPPSPASDRPANAPPAPEIAPSTPGSAPPAETGL